MKQGIWSSLTDSSPNISLTILPFVEVFAGLFRIRPLKSSIRWTVCIFDSARTILLSCQARQRVLCPYLSKPYSLVSPYVTRAESLGDSTLSSLDARFPAVKKPTGDLYNEGKDIVLFPLLKGTEGREYVLGVFGREKRRNEQDSVVGYGRAIIGTGIEVRGEAYRWVSGYLFACWEQDREGREGGEISDEGIMVVCGIWLSRGWGKSRLTVRDGDCGSGTSG
jgi:hypothetical protein